MAHIVVLGAGLGGTLMAYEMKEQLDKDVLLRPTEYYNAFVGGKIHRNHLKHLQKYYQLHLILLCFFF